MRLQYVTSATVLVEHNGYRVLCDPWLVDGAYGGAWYHNPPLEVVPEDFHGVQYCYISHLHPDHFDKATLARLDRKTVMLIASFADDFRRPMVSWLEAQGFRVVELGRDEPFALGEDFHIHVIPADDCDPQVCGRFFGCAIRDAKPGVSYQIDSLAVFVGGGRVITNTNDVPYDLARSAVDRVLRMYGPPDLLCVGYAGAGPWPQCFTFLSPEQMQLAAAEKREQFLHQAKQFIAHLGPKKFLPFAGQYTLGASLEPMNDLRGVPDIECLDKHFQSARMVRLNRMAWFDCETGEASEEYRPVPAEARREYRSVLARQALDHESDPMPSIDEIFQTMSDAQTKLWERCERRGFTSDWYVDVSVTNGDGVVCSEIVTFQRGNEEKKVINVEIDARLLMRILRRQFSLNNAEIGSLLTFTGRYPNEHDRGVQHHLAYWHL